MIIAGCCASSLNAKNYTTQFIPFFFHFIHPRICLPASLLYLASKLLFMRKGIIITVILLIGTLYSNAQLRGLMNKVKNKVENRADQKVDSEIDKTLDKAEGKKTGPASKENGPDAEPALTTTEDNSLKSYSKFDFIPGDSILYAEDFQSEELGELPANWNTSGTGEVTTLDKFPGQWLRLHKQFIYLSANKKSFGPNYTMEFDLILQLKNNGWMYPEFNIGGFASGDEPNGGNNFLKDYKKNAAFEGSIYPAENSSSRVKLESWLENKAYYTSDVKAYEPLEKSYGNPVNIAIQVQN